jgi:hypothetical protein
VDVEGGRYVKDLGWNIDEKGENNDQANQCNRSYNFADSSFLKF